MLEVEVLGLAGRAGLPRESEIRALCETAAAARGVGEGHVAVEFVDAERIAQLNARHRGRDAPTDVLSFPIDGPGAAQGERELGDVVICPEHTADVREAVVHGVLHLLGMDHEVDDGEMLALQRRLLGQTMARSGFVALAGRPNVGKSTLVNAIVGRKVAIVSDRPQTTRRAIRGVRRSGECEIVLVDLPGMQRPRDALTERMAGRVRHELQEADAALLLLNGAEGVGPGDRFLAATLAEAQVPVVVAVNKIDRLRRAELLAALEQAAALEVGEDVFPISARDGSGVGELTEHLCSLMPEGPFMFEERAGSDQPREVLIAELVREAAIRRTFQEVPHAVEVQLEELEWPRVELARVRALIWVETPSQKAIVIGAGGRMVKAIGSAARRELERELGCRVHLDLSVRVRRDWRADESLLDRLGIT